jgi:hypothetical protein
LLVKEATRFSFLNSPQVSIAAIAALQLEPPAGNLSLLFGDATLARVSDWLGINHVGPARKRRQSLHIYIGNQASTLAWSGSVVTDLRNRRQWFLTLCLEVNAKSLRRDMADKQPTPSILVLVDHSADWQARTKRPVVSSARTTAPPDRSRLDDFVQTA